MGSILLLVMVAAVGDVSPLSDSQRERAMTAEDKSETFDEAAFYALLENVEKWPEAHSPAEAVLFDQMIESPEEWRGQMVSVTGTLVGVDDQPLQLAQAGYAHVKRWFVRLPNGRIAICFLTDPPQTYRLFGTVSARDERVRFPARFYKLITSKSERQGKLVYPAFIGRGTHAFVEEGGSVDMRIVAIVMSGFILFGFWALKRLRARRRALADLTVSQRLAMRRGRSVDEDDEEEAPEVDESLPSDPAEALGSLRGEEDSGNSEEEGEVKRTLPKDPATALDALRHEHDEQDIDSTDEASDASTEKKD